MTDIAKIIAEDRANPARCFFHGQTPLGGTDACRPELAEDGSILLRSLNLSHTVYRVTEDEYRELRKYPQRKVGMWEFVSDNDPDADNVAYATRSPQGAGRRIGSLERELERLRGVLSSIELYGSDTLSGPTGGVGDREWYRDGVREMRNRARAALPTSSTTGEAA